MKFTEQKAVSTLFIFSGAAGLLYQIMWFKELSYFLGNSTYAQSILLATYMGGLAIGAWYWGRKIDSSSKALKIFAWLEIGIALYCFSYPFIFNALEHSYIWVVSSNDIASDSGLALFFKLIVSVFAIIVPTILMGGTLPALVKYFSQRIEGVATNVARFYFLNSLGAVVGTFLGGFILLQYIGLNATNYIAAFIDLIIGLICLFLAKNTIISNSKVEKTKNTQLITKSQNKIVFLIAGVSGVTAMIYEIVWLRLLIPILSSSTYSFTIILTIFILGITIGSYVVYRKGNRIKNSYQALALCQFGIVITTLISMPFYDRLPYYIWSTIGEPSTVSYSYYNFIQLLYVSFLILPPTLFMGASLPIASKLYVKDIKHTGKSVGNIFAINTLGTVIGSLTAGLFLIPLIGIKSTLELTFFLNVAFAGLIFFTGNWNKQKLFISLTILLISIAFYGSNVSKTNWANNIMLSEVTRKVNRISPPTSFDEFQTKADSHDKILHYQEGVNGTIVVAESNKEKYLFTNGKGDANSVSDLSTQISLGLTPLILHNSPDSVFVIGFGAGTTIGHVVSEKRVKYAEVAEISSEVIDASIHFNDINNKPLENSKLKVIRDDGLSALSSSLRKFDVIISQPSNPWSAGVGNLFTKEFFSLCKTKLKPGGYVAQWFNLYEMDDKGLKLILRTALSQFKHIALWHIGNNDILLLCSETEINSDLTQIRKNYLISSDDLKKVQIHSFTAFLSQQLISNQETINQYAGHGVINSQNLPLLEHWAPMAYYYNSRPIEFYKLDERSELNKHENHLLQKHLNLTEYPSDDEILQAGLFQSTRGNKNLAFALAELNPYVYLAWSEMAKRSGNLKMVEEYELKAKLAFAKIQKNPANSIDASSIETNHTDELNRTLAENKSLARLHYKKGTQFLSSNKLNDCIKSLEIAIKLDPNIIDAYNNLAIAKGKQGKYKEVINILNKAERISKTNARVYFNRGYAYALSNQKVNSLNDFNLAIKLNPSYGLAYFYRARTHLALGNSNKACADLKIAITFKVSGAQELFNKVCR